MKNGYKVSSCQYKVATSCAILFVVQIIRTNHFLWLCVAASVMLSAIKQTDFMPSLITLPARPCGPLFVAVSIPPTSKSLLFSLPLGPIQAMADAFGDKRKAGLVQGHSSGFGGTGFKFDKEEDQKIKQARKAKAKVRLSFATTLSWMLCVINRVGAPEGLCSNGWII